MLRCLWAWLYLLYLDFSYQKQTVQIFEMFEIKFFDPVPLKCRKESWKKILKGLKSVFILLSNFSCSELFSCSKNLEIQSKLWRDDVWKFNVYLNSEYFCQRRRQVHLMMMKRRTMFDDLMTIKWMNGTIWMSIKCHMCSAHNIPQYIMHCTFTHSDHLCSIVLNGSRYPPRILKSSVDIFLKTW